MFLKTFFFYSFTFSSNIFESLECSKLLLSLAEKYNICNKQPDHLTQQKKNIECNTTENHDSVIICENSSENIIEITVAHYLIEFSKDVVLQNNQDFSNTSKNDNEQLINIDSGLLESSTSGPICVVNEIMKDAEKVFGLQFYENILVEKKNIDKFDDIAKTSHFIFHNCLDDDEFFNFPDLTGLSTLFENELKKCSVKTVKNFLKWS